MCTEFWVVVAGEGKRLAFVNSNGKAYEKDKMSGKGKGRGNDLLGDEGSFSHQGYFREQTGITGCLSLKKAAPWPMCIYVSLMASRTSDVHSAPAK